MVGINWSQASGLLLHGSGLLLQSVQALLLVADHAPCPAHRAPNRLGGRGQEPATD